jgi:phosphatidylserine/phosphatidylglycerophosphate/cardiolipin synthase-like enzyme
MSRIEGPATKATLGAMIEQLKANGAEISPAEEASYRKFGDAQVARPGMSPIWTIDHHGPVDLYNKSAILSMIDVAPRGGHIYLEQPYVNDPDLFAALERAAREGVNVHVIVPRNNNESIVAIATKLEYQKTLACTSTSTTIRNSRAPKASVT